MKKLVVGAALALSTVACAGPALAQVYTAPITGNFKVAKGEHTIPYEVAGTYKNITVHVKVGKVKVVWTTDGAGRPMDGATGTITREISDGNSMMFPGRRLYVQGLNDDNSGHYSIEN